MREIKFRALDDGKMIYEKDIHHLSLEDNHILRLAKFWCNIRNDSIVMQFTGLKDKSTGVEVYESDICHATFKTKDGYIYITGEIIWEEEMWCIRGENIEHNEFGNTFPINRVDIIEVIGNIYQNPGYGSL